MPSRTTIPVAVAFVALAVAATAIVIEDYADHTYYTPHLAGQSWEDISAVETVFDAISSADDGWATIDVAAVTGWGHFPFYGHPLQELHVSTNGFVSGQPQYCSQHGFCNWQDGDHEPTYTSYIAPLMTDLTMEAPTAKVSYHADASRIIVQWTNANLYGEADDGEAASFTFQVVLEYGGGVHFNYQTVPFDPTSHARGTDAFPLVVGVQDAVVANGFVVDYHPVDFSFAEATAGSVQLDALPTCLDRSGSGCDACVSGKGASDTMDQCVYCWSSKLCVDGLAREVGNNLECLVGSDQISHTENQCEAGPNFAAGPGGMSPGGVAGLVVALIVVMAVVSFLLYKKGVRDGSKAYIAAGARRGGKGKSSGGIKPSASDVEMDSELEFPLPGQHTKRISGQSPSTENLVSH